MAKKKFIVTVEVNGNVTTRTYPKEIFKKADEHARYAYDHHTGSTKDLIASGYFAGFLEGLEHRVVEVKKKKVKK